MQLGRMIRALGLATVQIRELRCESACALAFVGGNIRTAAPGSIGVHQSYLTSKSTLDRDGAVDAIQQLTGDVLAYLKEMGVDQEFLQLSLSYSPDDIRYLSGSEMARMHVTTEQPVDSAPLGATSSPSEPSSVSAQDLESRAFKFVASVVESHMLNNTGAINSVLGAYADTVQYYGKPTALRDVLADKQAYFKRWPERAYRLQPDSVSVVCNENICLVSGLYDWAVRSLPRNRKASGTASFSYTIETAAGMKIVGETSEVTSR
jgi:hypothetical protein